MSDMCDGCAFRKGTEANKRIDTQIAALGCVETGETFYCHKPLEDFHNEVCPELTSEDDVQDLFELFGGVMVPCAGWLAIVEHKGINPTGWKAQLYEIMEDILDRAKSGELSEDEAIAELLLKTISD